MSEEEVRQYDSLEEEVDDILGNDNTSDSLPLSRYQEMVFPSLQSLPELCSVRIAYLMWTRQEDVTKKITKELLFDQLVEVVLKNVKNLKFVPPRYKYRIIQYVKPTGQHLLSLLSLWFELHGDAQNYLTNKMLFESLVLKADGMINQRKTAEKILSSRMLPHLFAFRFACINYLEKEVLKLWVHVKELILNRLILENSNANFFITQNAQYGLKGIFVDLAYRSYIRDIREYPNYNNAGRSQPFPFTDEPYEVLFWIGYCLSKENAISIEKLPHFLGDDVDWCEFSLEFASFSGNVACFDYFRNICNIEYDYLEIIKANLRSEKEDRKLPCFVFHFLLLSMEEKTELFQQHNESLLIQFFRWPLSLSLVDNAEKLWNLMGNKSKLVIFRELFKLIFAENIALHPLRSMDCHSFKPGRFPIITGMYSREHLSELWVDLWEIGSNTSKFHFYDSFLLPIIERKMRDHAEKFVTSGLKFKLFHLFLKKGEVVLELFENQNIKQSLRNLVAKHMPEYFGDLYSRCLTFFPNQIGFESKRKKMADARYRILSSRRGTHSSDNIVYPAHGKFLNYIENIVFSFYGN